MTFGFEYHSGGDKWEPVGEGAGSGDSAVVDALNTLKSEGLSVDRAGTYRYSYPGEDRWRYLDLDLEGNVRFTDRPS